MPNRRELGYVSAGSINTVYVSTGIYGRATGGIGSPTAVTIGSTNYEYLTFNATGTLTVTTAGWFDYLAVGGGGGSVYVNGSIAGGGGGSGQVVIGSVYLDSNQTITVGGGSSFFNYLTGFNQASNTSIAATSPFTQVALGNSVAQFGNVTSGMYVGGGYGGQNAIATTAIVGNTTLGFRGGDSTATGNGGGGGSITAIGSNGSSTTGGAGAAGFDVSVFIGGSALFKAAGGGGGGSGAGGAGGSSGVGGAGSTTTTPTSAAANTGSGGGGGLGTPYTTGNGGSGICYIRWSVA